MTRPAPLVLAQGILPLLVLATFAIGAVSAVGRRNVHLLATMIIATFQLSSLAPALGADPIPAWAIAALGTDVVVLAELTDDFVHGLQDRGMFERFPHRLIQPSNGAGGIGVLSALPLSRQQFDVIAGSGTITATIDVDGRPLDIVAVHPFAPMTASTERSWRGLMEELHVTVRKRTDPVLIIGDFNATRWNGPFRDLLDAGMSDAHEARGKGLSRSWPTDGSDVGLLGPLMRLDHALVSSDVAVLRVLDVDLRSSDHRVFVVTLAVGP